MIKKSARLLLSLIALTMASGCASKIYAVKPTDIYILENKDICMSPYYFENVARLKIGK